MTIFVFWRISRVQLLLQVKIIVLFTFETGKRSFRGDNNESLLLHHYEIYNNGGKMIMTLTLLS